MIDSTFVKAIASLARDAEPKLQAPIIGDDPRRRVILNADGSHSVLELDPPPQAAVAGSIRALAAKCADWKARWPDAAADPDEVVEDGPEIWYSHLYGIVCVRGRDDRRETVTYPLTKSEAFQALARASLAKGNTFSQRDFVHVLRTLWKDAAPPLLLQAVNRIKWNVGQSGQADLATTGRTSIDKSLVADLSGVEKIPEYATFQVSVFAELEFLVGVEVYVAPNAVDQSFTLFTTQRTIEWAYRQADEFLLSQIGIAVAAEMPDPEHPVPAYNGRPG